jgi:hypothetical protein
MGAVDMLSTGEIAYQVRGNIAFGVSCGRTIFLDLQRNRYFGLGASLDAAFQQIVETDSLDVADPAVLARLERAGVIVAGHPDPFHSAHQPPQKVMRELQVDKSGVEPALVASCIWAQCCSLLSMRRKSMAWLPSWLEDRRLEITDTDGPPNGWQAIASAFAATMPVRPRADNCLPTSIAFLSVGLARRLDAKLVFGVHAAPFTAHCWVQAGDTVLNDRLENVSTFTPILAL